MTTLSAGAEFGPYAIEGFIAGGGMGRVYAAAHSVYGNPVALKVLHARFAADPRWQQRFSQEGLVGTRLKHPHVLSARELVNHNNQVALVMDLVSGGQTLLKVIDREFPSGLELSDALAVFLQIVSGVEYLHDRSIIHGDLKPENVLVSGNLRNPPSWTPQVTDFGTVALIADPVQLDGKAAIVASPRYASPEHMLGIDQVTATSDVYSLGLILHYLLSGQHISTARTVPEAKTQLTLDMPLVHLVDQPEGVIQVVQKATSRDATERYPDCRALALAIRDRLDDMGLGLKLEDLKAELATELIDKQSTAQRHLVQGGESADGDTEIDLRDSLEDDTQRSEDELEEWGAQDSDDWQEQDDQDEDRDLVHHTSPPVRSQHTSPPTPDTTDPNALGHAEYEPDQMDLEVLEDLMPIDDLEPAEHPQHHGDTPPDQDAIATDEHDVSDLAVEPSDAIDSVDEGAPTHEDVSDSVASDEPNDGAESDRIVESSSSDDADSSDEAVDTDKSNVTDTDEPGETDKPHVADEAVDTDKSNVTDEADVADDTDEADVADHTNDTDVTDDSDVTDESNATDQTASGESDNAPVHDSARRASEHVATDDGPAAPDQLAEDGVDTDDDDAFEADADDLTEEVPLPSEPVPAWESAETMMDDYTQRPMPIAPPALIDEDLFPDTDDSAQDGMARASGIEVPTLGRPTDDSSTPLSVVNRNGGESVEDLPTVNVGARVVVRGQDQAKSGPLLPPQTPAKPVARNGTGFWIGMAVLGVLLGLATATVLWLVGTLG